MSAQYDEALPPSTTASNMTTDRPDVGKGRDKVSKSNRAALDLDASVGIWEGTAVFVSEPKIIRTKPHPQRRNKLISRAGPSPANEAEAELDTGKQPETGPQTPRAFKASQPQDPSGSAHSPISIASSSPSPSASGYASQQPLDRPRAVPSYPSPLPRTAFTPPRSYGPAQSSTSIASQATSHGPQAAKPIHPFFTRTRSVPSPSQPRYVAHYSSTEASQSQSTESQTTSASASVSASQVSNTGRVTSPRDTLALDELAEAVGRIDMEARPWAQNNKKPLAPSSSSFAAENDKGKAKAVPNPHTAPQIKSKIIAKPNITQLRPPDQGKENRDTSLHRPLAGADNASPALPYFHYSTYPVPPKLVYTSHPEEANDLLSCLRGNVFGFDLEWPPAGEYTVSIPGGGTMKKKIGMTWDESRRKWIFGQGRTALMQFCDETLVVLIHLGENMDIPSKAIDIILDPKIYKLGVQVKGDGQKLLRDFPIHFALPPAHLNPSSSTEQDGSKPATSSSPRSPSAAVGPAGLLELSYLARAVDPIGTGPGTTLISLANLTKSYLGKELAKPAKVRRGNWFEALDQEAKEYAANDVYAALQIFNTLMASAKEQDFTPDLDSYCSQVGSSNATTAAAAAAASRVGNRAGMSFVGANEVRMGERTFPLPEGVWKAPPPAQLSALENFMDGKDIRTMADLKGVKVATIEGYICQALEVLGIEILEAEDRRRLWDQIPRESYTWKKSRKTYKALKREFSGGDDGVGVESESSGSEEEDMVEIR
ncbi:hypothetical protein I316_01641 [Kwoniella heveanensis BCC8398]|uniref:Uncharacterized protein n=1 Tax=Kwoniella heveanensis BCC8398 TaxID=1296120 RepID=A0A1B9GZD7_9TREE|nr:hypothetical protein I316_01641 [Kwoniella heveanensis BCC8398]